MIDWGLSMFFVGLGIFIGVLWFFTIKDIIQGIYYLKSQEKTDGANNNDCDNKPEPDCMRVEKDDYLFNCQNQANKRQDTCRGNRKTTNKLLIGKFHINRIVSRVKRLCNQKQIKPIGDSTAGEIEYAKKLGKPIKYLEDDKGSKNREWITPEVVPGIGYVQPDHPLHPDYNKDQATVDKNKGE